MRAVKTSTHWLQPRCCSIQKVHVTFTTIKMLQQENFDVPFKGAKTHHNGNQAVGKLSHENRPETGLNLIKSRKEYCKLAFVRGTSKFTGYSTHIQQPVEANLYIRQLCPEGINISGFSTSRFCNPYFRFTIISPTLCL